MDRDEDVVANDGGKPMSVSSTVKDYLRLLDVPAGAARRAAWVEQYEAAHPDVFTTYYSHWGNLARRDAAADSVDMLSARISVREQRVRLFARDAGAELYDLGVADEPDLPLVMLVGGGTSNGWVADHRGVQTLFVALEFLDDSAGDEVLVLHEATHLAHLRRMASPWPPTVLEALVSEGLAVALTRLLRPGLSDSTYLWFDEAHHDWPMDCARHGDAIREAAVAALDSTDPDTVADLFATRPGSSLPSRSGYWLADRIIETLLADGHAPRDLMTWEYTRAREAVSAGLASAHWADRSRRGRRSQ